METSRHLKPTLSLFPLRELLGETTRMRQSRRHFLIETTTVLSLVIAVLGSVCWADPPAAGNDKQPILPASDGKLTLSPELADITGGLQLHQAAVVNIGSWDATDGMITWRVHFDSPQSYDVTVKASAQDGASSIDIVDRQGAVARVAIGATGSWDTYQTFKGGVLSITAPGDRLITVQPSDQNIWKPINVAQVVLTPLPK